jgi:hypothetical protein
VKDPLRPWETMTLDDARDELRRAEALAASLRDAIASDPEHASVYRLSLERASERATAYREALIGCRRMPRV